MFNQVVPDAAERGLTICLFSAFRVFRSGIRVDDTLGSKSRSLMKVLAANPAKCLPKDALMEFVWPQHSPSSAATSLKVAAHKLRQALGSTKGTRGSSEWIVAEKGSYRLNRSAAVWIDVEAFFYHHRLARGLLAAGANEAARLEFEKAEQLYTGDYLEEDIYDDWTVIRREELRDLYLEILRKLATLCMAERRHEDVIRYCHKIVLADPCREDAYQMLMRSHGALNQVARAGSWYAVCRATLFREIGTSPNMETVRTFEELFGTSAFRANSLPA